MGLAMILLLGCCLDCRPLPDQFSWYKSSLSHARVVAMLSLNPRGIAGHWIRSTGQNCFMRHNNGVRHGMSNTVKKWYYRCRSHKFSRRHSKSNTLWDWTFSSWWNIHQILSDSHQLRVLRLTHVKILTYGWLFRESAYLHKHIKKYRWNYLMHVFNC